MLIRKRLILVFVSLSFYSILAMKNLNPNKLGLQLIQAVQNNDISRVNTLIISGANINIRDHFGYTALILSSEKNYKEIVKLLIEIGADVNLKKRGGDSALMVACSNGYKDISELLIKSKKININSKNMHFETPLIGACYYGHKDIVKLLLDFEADINIKSCDSSTAFYWATNRGYAEIVELLISYINNLKNCLYKAIEDRDSSNFKKNLLKLGTIQIRDKNGDNLLHYVIRNNNVEYFKIILLISPDLLYRKNNIDLTPFDLIIQHANKDDICDNNNFLTIILNLAFNN